MTGWHRTAAWWSAWTAGARSALGVAAAAAVVMLAVIVGTQVVAMTRLLEGYWRWTWATRRWGGSADGARASAGKAGGRHLRSGLPARLPGVPARTGPALPTRLGNALRAAESYPGDEQRWGLDAVFWWPRLYLILPDSARDQVDDARAALDQLVVLTLLSAAFSAVALALSCAGLNLAVGLARRGRGFLLSRACYLAAVATATSFGDLIRSCYDLFRGDLLARLGWPMPPTLERERQLWGALGQQLYRRGNEHGQRSAAERPPPACPSPAVSVSACGLPRPTGRTCARHPPGCPGATAQRGPAPVRPGRRPRRTGRPARGCGT